MADTGIFATTAEIQYKAGARASTTYTAEAYTNSFIAQAESFINCTTRFNWSDAYTGLNADVKGLLKECASCLAAQYCINADYTNFFSMAEAQTTLNVLQTRIDYCLRLLAEIKTKDFVRSV